MADDGFKTTRWSVIAAAKGPRTPDVRAALDTLCRAYWYPLYAWVRRRGLSPEDARDATQGFFAALLSRDDLAGLQPEAGRFRAWLLACMKHFLANLWEANRAQKRGGGLEPLALDDADAERRYLEEPSTAAGPDALYERRWALTVMFAEVEVLKAEYEDSGRGAVFTALQPALAGELPRTYAEVGAELGLSEAAVKVAVHRLRRRYAEALRARLADTVASSAEVEVDVELDTLIGALS
jgi:RNA polymerase sigma-70 factor (ECF subfamily)